MNCTVTLVQRISRSILSACFLAVFFMVPALTTQAFGKAAAPDRDTALFVRPEFFGARAGDQLDDSKAFQQAIAAAAGRTIMLGAGTYLVNLQIGQSFVRIDGNGATLKPFVAGKPVITMGSNKPINDISIANLVIDGNGRQGDGILIQNKALEQGTDFVHINQVKVKQCNAGFRINGRCIWSRFTNNNFDFNNQGMVIDTDLPCNLLYFTNCTFNHNQRSGVYVHNRNAANESFKTFEFSSCNMEGNGADIKDGYGAWFSGVESLLLHNLYVENNGQEQPESSGLIVTGDLGRGISIDGGWFVGSRYPIVIEGSKKWGTLRNLTAFSTRKDGYGIILKTKWHNNEPKIEVEQCFATVSAETDEQGNLPLRGVDWVPTAPQTIDMLYRDWLKLFADNKDVSINSIKGLHSGRTIGLINYTRTGHRVRLDAALMADGKAFTIPANTSVQFIVDGYPTAGKLRPICAYPPISN